MVRLGALQVLRLRLVPLERLLARTNKQHPPPPPPGAAAAGAAASPSG